MNLPPFYVNQKIVYITGVNAPKDSIWIVRKIEKHPVFGWLVYVDFTIGININGAFASSFKPLQEQTFPLITYSKIQEEVLICAN
jgi:hypothetical protein